MKQIKEFLQKIIDGDLSLVYYKHYGICSNLDLYVWDDESDVNDIDVYDFIKVSSIGWEHHTGDEYYPVRRSLHDNKWEGEQLKLRQSLCNYILDNMEQGNE